MFVCALLKVLSLSDDDDVESGDEDDDDDEVLLSSSDSEAESDDDDKQLMVEVTTDVTSKSRGVDDDVAVGDGVSAASDDSDVIDVHKVASIVINDDDDDESNDDNKDNLSFPAAGLCYASKLQLPVLRILHCEKKLARLLFNYDIVDTVFFSYSVMNCNWSATKQHLPVLSVARISRHSALSGDRIRHCGTSFGSRRKDTDKCL